MSDSNQRDEQWFWDIIRQSRGTKNTLTHNQQIKNLTKILYALHKADIIEFDKLFRSVLQKSYTWDLWGAAYIINGGCSDDKFDYFRSWLVGQGEDVFYKAINKPETLVDVVRLQETYEWEGLEYCALDAYEKKTGEQFKPYYKSNDGQSEIEPIGQKWKENELPTRFPGLWRAFAKHVGYQPKKIKPKKPDPSKIGATFVSTEIPKAEYWIDELKKRGHDVAFRLLGEAETDPAKISTDNYAGYLIQERSRLSKDGTGILVKNMEKLNGQVKIEFEIFDKKITYIFKDISLILADQLSPTIWTGSVEFTKQEWLYFLETGTIHSV
jgi:hypothetical protein